MNLPVYRQHNELRHLLKEAGCFESQQDFYAYRLAALIGALLCSLAILCLSDIFWLQLLNATFLAALFVQFSLYIHDVIHRQAWNNDLFDILIGNFILGLSCSWWFHKHNKKHHAYCNRYTLDEDLNAPLLALTEKHLTEKKGWEKSLIRYQAFYYFPLLLLIPFAMHAESIAILFTPKAKHRTWEAIAMALHFAIFGFCLWVSPLTWVQSLIFLTVFKGAYGLYLGSAFVINHVGMPVLDVDQEMDYFISQIVTSRNIKANPVVDFLLGGLNAQIEHHLFPNMPRPCLQNSRPIVKAYCDKYNITYHETSFWGAYRETLKSLNDIGQMAVSR